MLKVIPAGHLHLNLQIYEILFSSIHHKMNEFIAAQYVNHFHLFSSTSLEQHYNW